MTRGVYISGFGHGAFVLWLLVGGLFMSVRDLTPIQVSNVSMITSAEFAALQAVNEPPIADTTEPQILAPDAQDIAPDVSVAQEETLAQTTPDQSEVPLIEAAPNEPAPMPEPPINVADELPAEPSPLIEESPPVIAPPANEAVPAPAPRVAPEAAPEVAPETQVADTVSPEIVANENADTQAPEAPATAPQEAATQIVTEAETPKSAPIKSPRPLVRPKRATPTAVETQTPPADAIADAVAEAATSTAPVQPTGPPLTGSEKDALRVSVQKCWNVGSLSSEAISTTVVVSVRMGRDAKPERGSLRMLSFSGGSQAAADQAYEAARRAIIRCGAKGFDLPVEKYSQWQDIEMTFNPEGMRLK